jgi:predicted nucleic acid-binding protein
VFYKWLLITADPDDNKFVDCAISANANSIVTNDKHFNILKDIAFPKVNVIDIDLFKKIVALI